MIKQNNYGVLHARMAASNQNIFENLYFKGNLQLIKMIILFLIIRRHLQRFAYYNECLAR